MFTSLLKGLLENVDRNDGSSAALWNFVYERSYLLMTSCNFDNDLNPFDLGICFGLCISLFTKKSSINTNEDPHNLPFLLDKTLKKTIT